MPIPAISYVTTLPLKHNADCTLLGVTPDQTIYAEEIYGENGALAQYALRLDGTVAQSVDEGEGADEIEPLRLPPEITQPKTGWHTMALNFAGPRHRGLRAPERVADLVRPLALEEKTAILKRLKLDAAPPLLLGVAESYVLAEAEIVHPNLYFVCRRVRFALALTEARLDAEHQPYDYDTPVIYLAHFYSRDEEPSYTDLLTELTNVPLARPMDCLLAGTYLYIADGGAGERPSAIHVWQLDLPGSTPESEKLHKKIYG